MKRTDPPPGAAPPTPVRNSIHRTGRTCLPISGTKPRIRRIRKRFWLWPLQTAYDIDAKELARDIARLVDKQKHQGGGHVVRTATPAHGNEHKENGRGEAEGMSRLNVRIVMVGNH